MNAKMKVILHILLLAAMLWTFPTVVRAQEAPTAIVVTSEADSGAGSLRQALADVADGGTITFAGDTTITLQSTLVIDRDVTIDGEAHRVTLSGDHRVRPFYVNSSVTASLNHLTVTSGYASYGGGVYNLGTLAVTDSTFSGNDGDLGGGIYNSRGTLVVTNSTFSSNDGDGAGIYNGEGGTLAVTDSTFSSNGGLGHWGGGIYNFVGTLTVTNSTFSGNSAFQGSVIRSVGGKVTVIGSTFSGNGRSGWPGGSIYSSGYLDVTNSTFSGNIGTPASDIYTGGATATVRNNLFVKGTSGPHCDGNFIGANNLLDEGTCGTGSINSPSILLGALGSYGGATQTVPLLPGSAAIDAGDPAYCPSTDQRGAERVGTCDIGAFESQGFALGSLTGTPQSALVNTAFSAPLGLTVTANDPVEPVDGGRVTFTPPADGATATISGSPRGIAGGVAGVTATANGTAGSYNVTASAAGAASVAFALTNDPVDTTLDDTPADPSYGGVTFAFSANAPAATFECRLDAGEWGACTSPQLYLFLSAAAHTFEVRAVDAFGSTDETPSSYTWNVAAVAPAPAGIVAPGNSYTCALKPDGAIECWGDNYFGQATSQSGPFTQVSAGYSHTCGLTPDGAVDCWGANSYGQAGGLHTGLSPYTQISTGNAHTCALTADGAVDCWGENTHGQATSQSGPYVEVTAGQFHTCGLTPEGAIDCWGGNQYGQADHRDGPYTQISAGPVHTCGLKPDGAIECWGWNYWGQATSQSGPYVEVTTKALYTCALTPSGAVDCWGYNSSGQADDQMGAHTQVTAGVHHTCALTPGGAVTCWGSDLWGAGGYHEGPYGAYVPQPFLVAINPASAPAGSGELSLTVAGSGFAGSSVVRWNGSDLATTYASDTELTAVVPAGSLAAVGTAQVTVYTPAPGGGTSSVLAFFVTEAAAGVVEQQVSSGTDPSASVAPATAAATGDGLLAVAQYDVNPGGTPSFNASGTYFDVYVAPDSSFSGVTITACELSNGDKLYWWDADSDKWVKAVEQTFADGCITLIVTDTSSPTLSQLQGTIFAAGNTVPVADPGGPYLAAINTDIQFNGGASTDADGDPLTFAWDFGDGSSASGVASTRAYTVPAIYDVCLTVNDGSLDSDPVCTIAVVYDPSDGFVTGGGWILSPVDAYTADPSLAGKAAFGFVSKYQKGASVPTGTTDFRFQAGSFFFQSSSYEWLVVSKEKVTAQFKGSGTVNGELDPNGTAYKFMLWAGDGSPDTFRIRIWWEGADGVENVVYDNGFNQPIGGGSIVVHTSK